VQAVCRYRETSAAGEVLAQAAQAQFEQQDLAGAVRTYEQAVDAYEEADAPRPPGVICGAAEAALKEATTAEARERAATRAHACMQASLHGDPRRERVLLALAKLRYEGLDLRRFDKPEPADRYFTKKPQRPTVDAVQVALDLPDAEEPAFDKVSEALGGRDATRAIAECFIESWETRHERQIRGTMVLKLDSKLRDMGYYDVYKPDISVAAGTDGGGAFESCLAESLTTVIQEAAPGNIGRAVSWQQPFEVAARVQ
jgi:hypothetical protein